MTTDGPGLRESRRPQALIVGVAITFAAVLAVALVIGLALQPFLARNGSTTLDRHVTDWFFTWRTPHGRTVMTRTSWIGGPILVIPVTAAVTLGLLLLRRWRLALFFVTTVAGAAVLNALAREIVDPRRPPGELGLRHPFASSFPSGHAAEATATYVGLGIVVMVLTRSRTVRVLVWTLVAALILAVGVARVYLAVHWTTDVLTGVVIGALWALGMARAFRLRAPSTNVVACPA
jgi:membrane-associated phospholipid phosphatase